MHTLQAVVDRGTRLTLDEFSAEFSRAWSRLRSRFLKLECWQVYQEQEVNQSQQAFQRGEIDRARELLRQEAEADRALYDDVRTRRIDYSRIRLVREPLTDYLRYEMMSYRIRAAMGEVIDVVVLEPEATLPSDQFFDFLLFDRHAALVHDYGVGDVGAQTGGWLVHDDETLESLERTALALRRRSTPLRRYVPRTRGQQ